MPAVWKLTCPWCGRVFQTPHLMQEHERQCPQWGQKGDGDG